MKRKPFQGVLNIIRFNWHFYILSISILLLLFLTAPQFNDAFKPLVYFLAGLTTAIMLISLLVSFYIYDLSLLYKFTWLNEFIKSDSSTVLIINAGFDETSELLEQKFKEARLIICDFYDPKKHTEISIKRARKAYPPNIKTIPVKTDKLPLADNFIDSTFAVLSTHEIRDKNERIKFFMELNRVTKSNGQIFIIEHLRDTMNFLAYNIGFFHFHSRSSWLRTFKKADFNIKREIKTTPFITTFIIEKNGNSL